MRFKRRALQKAYATKSVGVKINKNKIGAKTTKETTKLNLSEDSHGDVRKQGETFFCQSKRRRIGFLTTFTDGSSPFSRSRVGDSFASKSDIIP